MSNLESPAEMILFSCLIDRQHLRPILCADISPKRWETDTGVSPRLTLLLVEFISFFTRGPSVTCFAFPLHHILTGSCLFHMSKSQNNNP